MNTKVHKAKKNYIIVLAVVLTVALGANLLISLPFPAVATSYTRLDVTDKRQTFEGWGTSLAWWANVVGGWTMEGESGKTKREEIMDLIFGADGLNMNIVRYNIPGGENPAHKHMKDGRQMPLVKENSTSAYNWNADQNQLWVLKQANDIRNAIALTNGVQSDVINEVFSNSAPYWMTESGCVSGGNFADMQNISSDNFSMFATYIADYVAYLQNNLGIGIDYVEPLNEAGSDYWAANGTQEGMRVYEGDNQSQLILAVYNELVSRGLIGDGSDMRMTALDETSTELSVANWNLLSLEAKSVIAKINTHLYSHSVGDQEELNALAYGAHGDYSNPEYKLWMSEVSYGADVEPSTTDMKYAMELAFDVQENINLMGASAWVYWQVVESALQNMMYGNNYGLIHGVFQDVGNDEYGIDMDGLAISRGDYELTKQYYALGQYSRFIKQGYSIVSVESNVTENINVYNVAALSPDGTELVIVSTNRGGAEPNTFYLKGFNAESCKKIVTSGNKNWQESQVRVNGGYLSDTLEEQSITTYVIKGKTNAIQSDDTGVYFNGFITQGSGLYAQYYVVDPLANYTLYYATQAEMLPCNGGTEAISVKLQCSVGEHFYKNYDVPIADNYYAVIEKDIDDQKFYSAVLQGKRNETITDDFVYFTACGKTDKGSLASSGIAGFGKYYGLSDQLFDRDPFGSSRWGLVTEQTKEYNSDDIFTACRYIEEGNSIAYKYEVADDKTPYTVCLGFKDPWETADRAMDVYVNGSFVQTVESTKSFTTCVVDGVVGVYDSQLNGCFILVEVRQNAKTAQKPAINFIAIQNENQAAIDLAVEQMPAIALIQGESLVSKLPNRVNVLHTKGCRESSELRFDKIYATDLLTAGGGTARIYGTEISSGKSFEIAVGATDPTVQVYYYIDFGATRLTGELSSAFEGIKRANNDTLINTDALDRQFTTSDTWGRVGSDYTVMWENDPDKFASVIESSNGIRYWLPGLAAGKYVVEIGVNIHGWNISNRTMNFAIGETNLGSKADYNDKDVFVFDYDKTDDAPVMFECTSNGSEKPLLAYLVIKKSTSDQSSVEIATPETDNSVAGSETTMTVGNLTLGALLILRDDEGCLLADKVIDEQDVALGHVTFDNVNLVRSKRIETVQYLKGKISSLAVSDVPQLTLSSPRNTWSTSPDVIKVSASSESGIDKIVYKFGAGGTWIDIKNKKFIRAEQNGVYYVKMVSRSGAEVIKSVDVTHVDYIGIEVTQDVTQWTNGDVTLSFAVTSTNEIVSVKAICNDVEHDITDTLNEGKYLFDVTANGLVKVVVQSNRGGTKTMVVSVDNIDKQGVTLFHRLTTSGGVSYVDMNADSISDVKYMYSLNGEEFVALNKPRVLLADSGKYVFRALSQVGNVDEFELVYNVLRNGEQNSGVTVLRKQNTVEVHAVAGAELFRLDGDGSGISLKNNKATLSANGKYRVVYHVDGVTHIVDFIVDEFESANSVFDDKPTKSITWIWYVTSCVLIVCSAVCFIVGRRRFAAVK